MPLYELTPSLDRAAMLDELQAIPARLSAMLGGVNEQRFTTPRTTDDWSAFQTLLHMRDCAIVYSARFRWMVFDDDPFLPNFDEDNWVAAAFERPADAGDVVAEIAASRQDLMRVLRRMPDSSWQRTGRHEIHGSVMLEPYVRHQLEHERQHLEQISEALLA